MSELPAAEPAPSVSSCHLNLATASSGSKRRLELELDTDMLGELVAEKVHEYKVNPHFGPRVKRQKANNNRNTKCKNRGIREIGALAANLEERIDRLEKSMNRQKLDIGALGTRTKKMSAQIDLLHEQVVKHAVDITQIEEGLRKNYVHPG